MLFNMNYLTDRPMCFDLDGLKTMKIQSFLSDYGIKVAELQALSGQSGQTLRNWQESKPALILCLIGAYKWHIYKHGCVLPAKSFESEDRETINKYLEMHDTSLEGIRLLSDQSGETLRNWINSPKKYMMIDVLIYADRWYKNAIKTGSLKMGGSYEDCCRALFYPIAKVDLDEQFGLSKIVRKKNRKKRSCTRKKNNE